MTRAAIYATPAPDSALHRLASTWLGRDAFSRVTTRLADPERDALVAEPARYGFHATLRAPFRLKEETSLALVSQRLAHFCAMRSAPVISRLLLSRLGPFFALTPDTPEPALHALEGDVLGAFEPYRAALSAAEIVRRRPERLTPCQRALLDTWGYPFVREEFRFHMTLTGAVPDRADDVHAALERHFAPVLGRPLPLGGLGLFVETEPGADFLVHSFHPFGPTGAAKQGSEP